MVKFTSRRPRVSLTVSRPSTESPQDTPAKPALPWLAVAVLGSAGVVVVSWLAVAVVVSAAWLTAMRTSLPSALDIVGQAWLSTYGAQFRVADIQISLVPLGLTALATAGVAVATHYAAQGIQVTIDSGWARQRILGALVGASTASHSVSVLILASLLGTATQATAAFAGALGIGLVGSLWGGVLALDIDPLARFPQWSRAVGGAVVAGLATLALGSGCALVVGLTMRWDQAQTLQKALAPDIAGQFVLVAVYAAYLPTMLLWAGSYVLGSGFTLGAGTLVTPQVSALGLLPGLPPLAAVPTEGTPLAWGWLVVGVAAGVASGARYCLSERGGGTAPRWTLWTWQAAIPGALTACVWAGASWLSRGDMGSARLVGMGPLFPDLLWYAATPLIVASALTGLALSFMLRGSSAMVKPEVTDAQFYERVDAR